MMERMNAWEGRKDAMRSGDPPPFVEKISGQVLNYSVAHLKVLQGTRIFISAFGLGNSGPHSFFSCLGII